MKMKKMLAVLTCMCLTAPTFANLTTTAADTTATLMGDVNDDSKCSVADLVMLNRYILGAGSLKSYSNADINQDGSIDVFDMNLLRNEFTKNNPSFELPDISVLKNLTEDYEKEEVRTREADRKFILGQTDFALSLFKNVVKEDENVFISPYSVMQALAMTANGADGETKAEMEKVLGGISIDELNEYLNTQRERMISSEDAKINIANSIWTRNDPSRIVVYPEFLQKTKNYFDSETFRAPFDDSTVKDVNNWVSEKTDKMISEIIRQIDKDSLMILINTILFDAEWSKNYDEYQINENGKFTAYDGTVQDAVMMYSSENRYIEDENVCGFIKDYKGYKYSFAAILPNEGISVDEYVKGLTAEKFNSLINNASYKNVDVTLPKFTYEYGNNISEILQEMGMPTAFDYYSADFSKMAKTLEDILYIGSVIHKTKIEVTEYGTKAAGVTAVIMDGVSGVPTKPKEVILDRPFVFSIIDNETSLPVFIGTLTSIPEN